MCASDGYEFALTQKKTQNGKISSHYDPFGNPPKLQPDNHYALDNTVYPDLYQCSVELTRTGDNDFEAALLNWKNSQVSKGTKKIPGSTGTAKFTGLPLDLMVGKTGAFDTKVTFEYGNNPNGQVAYFKWDSESEGDGRGPATDIGKPLRFCKNDVKGKTQKLECWFPCYEK